MNDIFSVLQTAISAAERLAKLSSLTAADKTKAEMLLSALKSYKGTAFALREYSINTSTDTAA